MNTRTRYIPGKDNIISDFITRNIADLEKLKVINRSLMELSNNSDATDMLLAQRQNEDMKSVFEYFKGG